MAFSEYETGVCPFTVKYKVFTYTSGNELRGDEVFWNEFPSERDAAEAMANSDMKFTKTEWGWRSGSYTTASIRRVGEYGDPINS